MFKGCRLYLTTAVLFVLAGQTGAAFGQPVGATPETAAMPQWPDRVEAPAGAPNVLLIMTDDVGFGATSTFGGPIPTSAFEALANEGVRYNQFNTSALCSPTRAALLTGRNPQAVGMGNVTNLSTAYPGYTSIIPKSAATVAQVLRDAGYSTSMFGKAHITPEWEQSSAGPFDRWPTGLGFEHFYGFLNADASQFEPALVRDTTPINPATGRPDYVLDRDLADQAIGWISEQKALGPEKPFFLYYATGTAHAPHHAPNSWLEKFRGKFDQGWDRMREETFRRQKASGAIPASAQLTPRPSSLPAWDTLNADQKRLYARHMEAYAAALAFADYELGRVIQHLKDTDEFDNTLVIYIQGDNGGSAEGTLDGLMFEQSGVNRVEETMEYKLANIDNIGTAELYAHFPAAWAWALNTPFQHYKQVASHFGGTRNGVVMSWPGHIPAGGNIRSQFHYVTDIYPTILEAAGIASPQSFRGVEQQPVDGLSMVYSFEKPDAPSQRKTQVFEMMQNLGIYHDGWFAGTTPARPGWEVKTKVTQSLSERPWELYNVSEDFSEAVNLASSEPERLAQMKELFWQEAQKNSILPIHSSATGEGAQGRPSLGAGRKNFVYKSRIRRVPQDAAPHLINRSFSIAADISVDQDGGTGAIYAQGGRYSGYSLAIIDGLPTFTYNAIPPHIFTLQADQKLAPGKHRIEVTFDYDGGGVGKGGLMQMNIDGSEVASGRIEQSISRWISHTEGLDIGADTTTTVNSAYASPAEFTGEIDSVEFKLD